MTHQPHTFVVGQFSGPLDLLLELINTRKMAISELALGEVTEQYLTYLDTLEERRPEDIADFLVVATRLLLLKARQLLPDMTEEEEGPSLEEQLRLYQAFREAAKQFNRAWLGERSAAFRLEPSRRSSTFQPPANVSLGALHDTILQIIRRLEPPKPIVYATIDRAVSVREKIESIRTALSRLKRLQFTDMITDASNRTEVIVSFLAILELVKQQVVSLHQEQAFGDITIQRV